LLSLDQTQDIDERININIAYRDTTGQHIRISISGYEIAAVIYASQHDTYLEDKYQTHSQLIMKIISVAIKKDNFMDEVFTAFSERAAKLKPQQEQEKKREQERIAKDQERIAKDQEREQERIAKEHANREQVLEQKVIFEHLFTNVKDCQFQNGKNILLRVENDDGIYMQIDQSSDYDVMINGRNVQIYVVKYSLLVAQCFSDYYKVPIEIQYQQNPDGVKYANMVIQSFKSIGKTCRVAEVLYMNLIDEINRISKKTRQSAYVNSGAIQILKPVQPDPRRNMMVNPQPQRDPRREIFVTPHPQPDPRREIFVTPHPQPDPRREIFVTPHPQPDPRRNMMVNPQPQPDPRRNMMVNPQPQPDPRRNMMVNPHPQPDPRRNMMVNPQPQPDPQPQPPPRPPQSPPPPPPPGPPPPPRPLYDLGDSNDSDNDSSTKKGGGLINLNTFLLILIILLILFIVEDIIMHWYNIQCSNHYFRHQKSSSSNAQWTKII
jgi:hypothetical protein